MQLLGLTVPVTELGNVTRNFVEKLHRISIEDDPENRVFKNAGVQLVQRSAHITWRIKLASVFLRIEQDPRLNVGDLTHIAGPFENQAFASSSGLYDGIYLFDAYLGPLLGALTPSVWALSFARSFGTIVITLGQPLAGTAGEAVELLQLLSIPGAQERVQVPTISPTSSMSAVRWWNEKLNLLFGVLTDPAMFTDSTHQYQPSSHLQAVMSMEQLFRRVTSAQVAHRDVNARRVLLFTVLDTLERLTARKTEKHCELSFAIRTLNELRGRMPQDAAEILLPGAERAVAALRKVQNGFFIRDRTSSGRVEMRLAGEEVSMEPEAAAATYIKTLRDATHGHGSNRRSQVHRTDALLAHHDGEVPHDLGLLAYLYLLDLLCHPERLAAILHQGSRSR
jgi:hypothetical protein